MSFFFFFFLVKIMKGLFDCRFVGLVCVREWGICNIFLVD